MENYQKSAILHNGAIVVDVDTASWGDQPFDQEYYHFALVRRELRTIELLPCSAHAKLSMDPQQLVLVRPGDVERVILDSKSSEDRRVSLAAIMFRPDLIEGIFGSLHVDGRRDLVDPISAGLLQAAVHLDENSDPLLVDHITMAITSRLRTVEQREVKHKGRIERSIAYINERLEHKITLSELAGASAMSSFHFLRTFREVTGMTPLAYVTTKRVERAKTMLAKTDHPMSAISAACGFASQSHFSSAFKANTGASPRAFRVSMGRKIVASLTAAMHWIYEVATEPISAPLMAMA